MLSAVMVQEPTMVSVSETSACVQTLVRAEGRFSSRSKWLTAATLLLAVGCSIVAVLAAIATVVAWPAGELSMQGQVVDVATDARWSLWLLAGFLAGASVTTGVLEHRASRAAMVASENARVINGLAVEVVAVRAILATGVTRERRARAAASLRYCTLDGQHPHEAWTLQAAAFIEHTPGFGRATVLEPQAPTRKLVARDAAAGRFAG